MATVFEQVEAFIRAKPASSRSAIVAALGVTQNQVAVALSKLTDAGKVLRCGWGSETRWYVDGASPLHAPDEPSLEAGKGERRDCARYDGCLSAFSQHDEFRRLSLVRCPASCAFFKPPTRDLSQFVNARRSLEVM